MAPLNIGLGSNGSKRYGNSGSRNANGLTRVHSLALSDFSTSEVNLAEEEFVNPFADETDVTNGVLLGGRKGSQSSEPATPGPKLRNFSRPDDSNSVGNTYETPILSAGSFWEYSTAPR